MRISAPRDQPTARTRPRSARSKSKPKHSTARWTAPSTSANRSRATSIGSSLSSMASASTRSWSARSTRPPDGTGDDPLRGPPPGPVRQLPVAPLRLRPRPDGDPDPLHRLHDRCRIRPLEQIPAEQGSTQVFSLDSGPTAAFAPGSDAFPSSPRSGHLQPGGRRLLGFTLKLTAKTATSSSATSTSRCRRASPPTCAASPTAPRADRGCRGQLGVAPSRPPPAARELAGRNLERGRRARQPPLSRGRKDLLGRSFQGRSPEPRGDHPGPGRPLRLRHGRGPGRPPYRPPRRPGRADSETVPSIIGGIPIRMRSIQVNIDRPNFMINPTNCSAVSVDTQGMGDQGTVADFSSYFQVVNCASLPFKPKMAIKQLGGRRTKRAQEPSIPSTSVPAPATPTSNRSRSPCPTPLRSTRATSATSAEKELAPTSARGASRSARPLRRRRSWKSHSKARPTPSPAPAACPSGLHPQRPGDCPPGRNENPHRAVGSGPRCRSSPTLRSATSG